MMRTSPNAHSPLSSFPASLFLFFLLALLLHQANGQVPPPLLSDGIPCSADRSIYPCQAYALYRTDPSHVPLSADLPSVGDLFGVSRALIARATNLSVAASSLPLHQDQLLLVPLTCACDGIGNHSYSSTAYQITAGDTFYLVSSVTYGNLTSYPAVELVNPTLVPEDLDIGVIATFPIFCQCLKNNTINGRKALGLVTYILQSSDTYATVAASFGTDAKTLRDLNGPENVTSSAIFVPLYQIPPPLLRTNASSEALASPPPASVPAIEKSENKGVIAGLAVGLAIAGALCALQLLLLAWCWRRSRRKGEEARRDRNSLARSGKGEREARLGRLGSADEKLIGDISEWLDKYRVFDVEELRRATVGFDKSRLIQGSVYKGTMDGEAFAVKKMKWNACDELKILQKVNHTNLVKLEGFCIDAKEGTTYLVYEFVENGSLDALLRDPVSTRRLDWRTRLRIALDVATGLQYIHEHTRPRVVHKDIKSSNVLLDAHLHAKIANFGLASTGCNAVTTHIVGTQGYVAPEYLADGLVTTKMDVFAFGVVLLELITGREAVSAEGEALWSEAEGVLGGNNDGGERMEERLLRWMDAALVEQSCSLESVAGVMGVARACLHRDPSKRPSMMETSYMLSKADEHFSDFSGDGVVSGANVAAR